jgi:pSer/pThr/pTyr-binding forkhead associated (FHA) protein
MSARVQFTLEGSNPVQHFVFTEAQVCIVGRAHDCDISIPRTTKFGDVSRHHCSLRLDPPFVHVRDLGSLNGTFVNNARVGGRKSKAANERSAANPTWFPLRDGDELRLGKCARLRVEIHEFIDEQPDESTRRDKIGSGIHDCFPD